MKIGIVGLGYVGLQLAIAFGQRFDTIGYDLNSEKIEAYKSGIDRTGEVKPAQFKSAQSAVFTNNINDLVGCRVYIVAVPTPVDDFNQPDFEPLLTASEMVGRVLNRGAVVVYESTVFPGATEELCIPALERASGFKWKDYFHVGYSPERINPGDEAHTLQSITKVVSGDDEETLKIVSDLYAAIVPAGVHGVSSIRVAEAAKVIENTQRDLNIALVNELSIIFDHMGLDTTEVLQAAGSKWNFLPFTPGLVGGHCIGVDPYYLTYKAQEIGYEPQVILAGRRINDEMGIFVAKKTLGLLEDTSQKGKVTVNVLGVTFKENCTDTRNSQVFSLVEYLQDHGVQVFVADPLADPIIVERDHGIKLVAVDELSPASALVITVPHQVFGNGEELILKLTNSAAILVDVKSAYRDVVVKRPDITYWSL